MLYSPTNALEENNQQFSNITTLKHHIFHADRRMQGFIGLGSKTLFR